VQSRKLKVIPCAEMMHDSRHGHHVQVCTAVDKVMRHMRHGCVAWMLVKYVCGSCIKVNGVLEGGPTGHRRGGATC